MDDMSYENIFKPVIKNEQVELIFRGCIPSRKIYLAHPKNLPMLIKQIIFNELS